MGIAFSASLRMYNYCFQNHIQVIFVHDESRHDVVMIIVIMMHHVMTVYYHDALSSCIIMVHHHDASSRSIIMIMTFPRDHCDSS
jgi:hypothetical protein